MGIIIGIFRLKEARTFTHKKHKHKKKRKKERKKT